MVNDFNVTQSSDKVDNYYKGRGYQKIFLSTFLGYLEWGTRIAVINSQLTENSMVVAQPMPNFDWGEKGGPYSPDVTN